MCRSIAEGGRRCPNCAPYVRSVKRKLNEDLKKDGLDNSSHRVKNADRRKYSGSSASGILSGGAMLGASSVLDETGALTLADLDNPTFKHLTPDEVERFLAQPDKMMKEALLVQEVLDDPDASEAEKEAARARFLAMFGFPYSKAGKKMLELVKISGRVIAIRGERRMKKREWKVFRNSANEIEQLTFALDADSESVADKVREITVEREAFLKRLGAAYLFELNKVRKFNGSHSWFKTKDVEHANSALRCFPLTWVQKSEAMGELRVQVSDRRSHYESNKLIESDYTFASFSLAFASKDLAEQKAKELADKGEIAAYSVTESKSKFGKVFLLRAPKIYKVKVETDSKEKDLKSKIKTFYKGYKVSDFVESGVERIDGYDYTVFTAPVKKPSFVSYSLIRTTLDESDLAHELTHRFEDANPSIGYLEKEFLDERITKENGEKEPLVSIFGQGKGEVGYRDGFIDSYMGKVYPQNAKHYEIMSTGVEAVFFGKYGGLIYQSDTKMQRQEPDYDYRDFVLGMLALIR